MRSESASPATHHDKPYEPKNLMRALDEGLPVWPQGLIGHSGVFRRLVPWWPRRN